MSYLFVFLFAFLIDASWKELTCNGGKPCDLHILTMKFEGTKLIWEVQNKATVDIVGGNTRMTTQGYGCFIFFCQWQNGPVVDMNTCDYNGIECEDGKLINGSSHKTLVTDFREAIIQARDTDGCCSVDSGCGCMIKGVSVMKNDELGEYSQISLAFKCDFKTLECFL